MALQMVSEMVRVQGAAEVASKHATHEVGPLETHMCASDRLVWRVGQLQAMLAMISGDGLTKHFDPMNDELRVWYVENMANMVSAMRVDIEMVTAPAAQS